MSYGCRPLTVHHLSDLGLFVIPAQLRGLLSKEPQPATGTSPAQQGATATTATTVKEVKKQLLEPAEYTVKVQRLYAKRKPNTKVSWGGYGCVQKISGVHDAAAASKDKENKNGAAQANNKGDKGAAPSSPKSKSPLPRKTLDPRTGSVIEVVPNEHFDDRAAFWKTWRSNLKDMSAYLAKYEQFGPEVDNVNLAIFEVKPVGQTIYQSAFERYDQHGKA
ncbi:unnamed protein product [Amoebophrya sp. A25]|nr:unnamed protein product [Amoebophrya sp. A25]|eukprot:GSA25T00006352001.1